MSDVESPKPSDKNRDASKAKGSGEADEADINFGDPEPAPARKASDPGKSAALRSTDPNPISQREVDPAPSATQRPSSIGGDRASSIGDRASSVGDRKSTSMKDDRPTSNPRPVEMGSSEQKKLEDIRRKLKDIFVTAEKPEPTSDVVKASDQQTVSSGLLDLRHLAEARHGNRESTKVDDDMMHLSGGLFGGSRNAAALSAPDISRPTPPPAPKPPPPVMAAKPVVLTDDAIVDAEPEADPEPAPRKPISMKAPATPAPVVADPDLDLVMPSSGMSGRTIVALTIAGALLFGGVFYMVMRGGDEGSQSAASDTKTETQPSAEQGQRVGQPGTDTAPPAADPGSAAVVPGGKPANDKSSKSSDSTSTKGSGKSSDTKDTKEPKEPAGTSAPKPEATTAAPATAAPAETPKAPAPPAPSGNEFDRSAASSAMSAAASKAMGCKGEGPSGTASVSVTFAPSGRVTSAKVDGGPFSGTPTGGCIATAFRGVTVPPFDGSPVTVRKTVSIR
ncbi:MAG TPA: hypothetical protein VE093_02275 [Polyangiaceae bacterium]|nr:hypothetical protein [Polyangiaceae bacterium]